MWTKSNQTREFMTSEPVSGLLYSNLGCLVIMLCMPKRPRLCVIGPTTAGGDQVFSSHSVDVPLNITSGLFHPLLVPNNFYAIAPLLFSCSCNWQVEKSCIKKHPHFCHCDSRQLDLALSFLRQG